MNKTRRVGSISCGLLLIVFGTLFFLHIFMPFINLTLIMKLWPLILIAIGTEMLVANIRMKRSEERRVGKECRL